MKIDVSIVYLWAEITGYVYGVLEELTKYTSTLDVVHWDVLEHNSSLYKNVGGDRICFHRRTQTSDEDIYEILSDRAPSIIVVSGWMDKGYIKACVRYKRSNPCVQIVVGIDDQWIGSFRQHLGKFYYKLCYRQLFDYMWVAGNAQFAFARMFGYKQNEIIPYLYSGAFPYQGEPTNISRRFVYIGRLLKSKGVDLLIEAHKQLTVSERKKFPLYIVGNGELRQYVEAQREDCIVYQDWATPEQVSNILTAGGIGVMASRKEQWGVAIHEYTQHGLPVLLSDICGAANEVCLSGFNGYTFKSDSLDDLICKMRLFIGMSEESLMLMSRNSLQLSNQITPKKSAASLLSFSVGITPALL